MSERITDLVNLGEVIQAATKVNEDSYAVGLQPYEIRFVLNMVIAERKSIDSSLRHMPYLGGMHRTKSLATDLESAVKVMERVAENNGQIEADRDAMRRDIIGARRVFGTVA